MDERADKLHSIEKLLAVIKSRLESIEDVRLKSLEKKIDNINGSVRVHEGWIAAQKPVCGWHKATVEKIEDEQTKMRSEVSVKLAELRKTVTKHDSEFASRLASRSGVQATLTTIVSVMTLMAVLWVALRA